MNIILKQDVELLGSKFDVVTVRTATHATSSSLKAWLWLRPHPT